MSKNIQGDAYHGGENRDGMLTNTHGKSYDMDTCAWTSTYPGTADFSAQDRHAIEGSNALALFPRLQAA